MAPDGAACLICKGREITTFAEFADMPSFCNVLWRTREEALQAPRATIRLGFCGDCGYIWNLAFDPTLARYTAHYDNSLLGSTHFRAYLVELTERLVARHGLYGKDIVELGCGQGEFLSLLCRYGGNRGIGFDPAFVPDAGSRDSSAPGAVKIIPDLYSERYSHIRPDFVCCRQTLEHVGDPMALLTTLRRAIGDRIGTGIFFEVPDALDTLRRGAIWDIIHEHHSYFTSQSLARAFAGCGFDVCTVSSLYGGQYLGIDAVAGSGANTAASRVSGDVSALADDVVVFNNRYREKESRWRCSLDEINRRGQQAVLWGAGSKGVTFLNRLCDHARIATVVDTNHRKQGMYVPGTGQEIVAPERLRTEPPDVVIITNPIYRGEIQQSLAALGLAPEVVSA
jgi:hypothetical protein